MEQRIEELLDKMTLDEKVSMAAGSDMWHSTGVERLGVPPFKVTDGPNGARGGSFDGGVTSACLPVGISLAAMLLAVGILRLTMVLQTEKPATVSSASDTVLKL